MNKIIMAVLFSVLQIGSAWAGDQDFSLINNTGVEIAELYISPASTEDWGEDVLTVDTLPDGNTVDIVFSPEEDADFWDIKIVDGEGASVEWPHLKLTEISTIKLYFEDGEPMASYE